MKSVIVLGATSGIALEVERQLAERGCELLLISRSSARLAALQADLQLRGAARVSVYAADLSAISQHGGVVAFASQALPDFDTVLLAYGSMHDQALAATSVDVLCEELLVDFVSAAALLTRFAAGGAAKSGLSTFLQGLRSRLYPAGVTVITIKPGPVRTPLTDQLPGNRHFADPRQVARDIVRSLARRSPDILYTPSLWRWIMLVIRLIPESLFKRLSF